jgi:transposase
MGVIEPNQIFIEILIPQLQLIITSIDRMDKEIKQRYAKQADRKIFDSLPGAGPQLAPRLLVAFGSDRSRYNDATEIHKYAGIAPVIERSGNKYTCRDRRLNT